MLWWYNQSVLTQHPFALLYLHIDKCAGSSIVYWMIRHNPYLTLKLDFTNACIFNNIQSKIHDESNNQKNQKNQSKNQKNQSKNKNQRKTHDNCKHKYMNRLNIAQIDWKSSRIAVEYHSGMSGYFINKIVPYIDTLKSNYKNANGKLLTFTVLRNPLMQIESYYNFFVSHRHVTMERWLNTTNSIQVSNFLPSKYKYSSSVSNSCHFLKAKKTIDMFDFVFVVEHLEEDLGMLKKQMPYPTHILKYKNKNRARKNMTEKKKATIINSRAYKCDIRLYNYVLEKRHAFM